MPDDVAFVQETLNKIDPSNGGPAVKLEVTRKITGANDPTVLAIRRFQQKQFNFADGVVDPDRKTERRLLELAGGAAPESRQKDETFIDFVVRFRAGTAKDAKENLDATKLAQHAAKPNRQLHLISKRTTKIGDSELIKSVIDEIAKVLSDRGAKQGILCINGNSAGARNALELGAALKGKRAVRFLGCADAALFPDLPQLNQPTPASVFDVRTGRASNFPMWNGAPQNDAQEKLNFFQNEDNRWRLPLVGPKQWFGVDPGEIHGELPGFKNIQLPVAPGSARLPNGATQGHEAAGNEGDQRNGARISELLKDV